MFGLGETELRIIRRYLYGMAGDSSIPDLLSRDRIRAPESVGDRTIGIDAVTYMNAETGAGRFAIPAMFDVVNAFFLPYTNLASWPQGSQGAITNNAIIDNLSRQLGPGRYSRKQLTDLFNIPSNQFVMQQYSYTDGRDDAAMRTFIYGSSKFDILEDEDDDVFVILQSGERLIERITVGPSQRSGSSLDNFDYASDNFLTNALGSYLQSATDPSEIGQTVFFAYNNREAITPITGYTLERYQADLNTANGWSVASTAQSEIPLPVDGTKLLADVNHLLDQLFTGTTRFLDSKSRPIIYGKRGDGTFSAYPLLSQSGTYIAAYAGNGVVIIEDDGSDEIEGTQYNDEIFANGGDDIIRAGAGNDVIHGAAGADELYGGFGDDTLIIDLDDTFIDGGAGYDTLDLSNLPERVQWVNINSGNELGAQLGTQVSSIEKIVGTNFDDTFILKTNADPLIPDGNLDIDGGDGADTITGNDSENTFWGGEGDDLIDGGSDNDILRGGDGNDVIVGGAENYAVRFDEDIIYGGAGDDKIDGGDDEDVIYGEGDNDIILGGQGDDQIDGGSGDDVVSGGKDSDTVRGGAGDDIVDGQRDDSSSGLFAGTEDHLYGGADADIFLTNNRDTIHDIDRDDIRVKFEEQLLTGGERDDDDPKGVYHNDAGHTYTLADDGTLNVKIGGNELTILEFRNGYAGIKLTEAGDRPDPDQAERNRDPLVIDLDGDRRVMLASGRPTTYFDMNSDGFAELSSWVRPTDALLAIDRNGDGVISNAGELFGTGFVRTQGTLPLQQGTDGFRDLGQYDLNADKTIDANDAIYSQLRLWGDANSDGITDIGELKTLAEHGIQSISLRTRVSDHIDVGTTNIPYMSSVTRADGTVIGAYDVFFSIDPYDTRGIARSEITDAIAELPFVVGSGTLKSLDQAMADDSALEGLVREFSELQIGDAAEIADRVEEILFQWTGADAIAEDARGPNINARWLHVVEQLSGRPFSQGLIGPRPRADAASFLAADYSDYLRGFTAKLLGQTALGRQLLPGLTFEAGALFSVGSNVTADTLLTAAATGAPQNKQDAIRYWAAIIDVVDTFAERGGLASAGFSTQLDAILQATDLSVNANDLRNTALATSGSDLLVNAGVGNRILVADRSPGTLRGTAQDAVYIVGRVEGVVSIDPVYRATPGSSQQAIVLTEHRREDFVIDVRIEEDDGSGEILIMLRLVSQIDDTVVEFPATIVSNGLLSAISKISFASGSGASDDFKITDLLTGGFAQPDGEGQVFFGLSTGQSVVEGGVGNDRLFGFANADEYRFGPGGGNDAIVDNGGRFGGADTLILAGLRTDYRFEQTGPKGDDLRILHIASGNFITVSAQFSIQANQIETFRFDNGEQLTADMLAQDVTAGTSGVDNIVGTFRSDFIDGLGGADILDGRQGADHYYFETGNGGATIVDTDTNNIIRFGAGIVADDLRLIRDGRDLAIAYGAGDIVYLSRSTAASESPIASIEFDDGTSTTFAELVERSIAAEGTIINGELYGTPGADSLMGSAGNDLIDGLGGTDDVNGGGGNDTFVFREGNLRIFDGSFSFDTLLIPAEYTIDNFILELDRYSSFSNQMRVRFNASSGVALLPNRFTASGNPDSATADDIDQIVFADGMVIDLSQGSIETGTTGNDVLLGWRDRFHPSGATVFRPGAGNDYIFGGASSQTLELGSGFGRDIFFADASSVIRFTNISLNANTQFARMGNDLRISFTGTGDELTVKHLFDYQANAGISSVVFVNQTLNFQQVVSRVSVATANDDLLFGTDLLDGGAGDDILIGDHDDNQYVFARGYGNDVVKERDFFSGNNDGYVDTLSLVGLNRNDVTFSRDATDPLSIVITIKDTGETLKLDGSPFDGKQTYNDFINGGSYESDVAGAHWIEVIQFADGSTMSQVQLAQAVLDAEGTSGNDILTAFGSPLGYDSAAPVLDGGEGNDLYENEFRGVHLRLSADGGSDRLVNETTAATGFASYDRNRTYVHLGSDVDPSDVLVLFERRDSVPVTVLRTKFGSELVIEDRLYDGARSVIQILAADGRQFMPTEDGGLVEQLIGSQDIDYLTGRLDEDTESESSGFATTYDEVFESGEGDDFIAGRGGDDVLVFNRGDGNDTLLGDQGAREYSEILGRGIDGSGSYSIAFGQGIAATDIDLLWLDGLTDIVTIQIRGSNDRVNARAGALSELRFADGTIITLDGPQTVFFVDPGNSANSLTSLNETIIATGGDVTVELLPDGGRDILLDRRFEDALNGTGDLQNWNASEIYLLGGASLDDFDFIRDSNAPDNLVVRNRNTGAELTVRNQFALYPQPVDGWQEVPTSASGSLDWLAINQDGDAEADVAFLDPDQNGVVDWGSFETASVGSLHWEGFRYGSIELDGNGTLLAAFDNTNDGIFEDFELYRADVAGGNSELVLLLSDTDGDGIPDQYSLDGNIWSAVPLLAGGGIDWQSIDANGDGFADLAILDPENDGIAEWQTPDFDSDGTEWQTETSSSLIDAAGNVVGSRYELAGYAGVFYAFYQGGVGSGQLVAWDTDDDAIPDRYGLDFDYDGIADASPIDRVVDRFVLTVEDNGYINQFYFDWAEIEGRVVSAGVDPLPPSTYFDLASILPTPTQGNDRLRIVNSSLDSLAGDDLIVGSGDYATLHFGRGDGNDVFSIEYQPRDFGQPGLETAGSVAFDGIFELSELHFARGGDELNDLVITIRDTGETLTIIEQFSEAAVTVPTFYLADGQIVNWQAILPRIEGASTNGDNDLSTDDAGGLIDGGAGFDQLNGGTGDDVYRFGRGFDEDVIRDAGGFDIVRFDEGIAAEDLFFSRTGMDGADLLIEVTGEERLSLTIRGQFAASSAQVERFELADGSTISLSDVQRFILANSSTGADDIITGFDTNDRINASGGSDTIEGGRGNDLIDGGSARDKATYRGSAVDYEIATIDGVTTVRDLVDGRDGTDTLRNIEDLHFLGDDAIVHLVNPNTAPSALDYAADAVEDTDIVIALATLLALASDPDSNTLILRSVTNGENGRAWIDRDGNVRYRPHANFNGADFIEYAISDGNGGIATARINVAVAASNDAPTETSSINDQTSPEDRQIVFLLPEGLFSDVDGDLLQLTATLANGDSLPSWLSFDGVAFGGTPPANFNGRIELVVTASDGTATESTSIAFVILPVNDAPIASSDTFELHLPEDNAFDLALPAALFSDADGDALLFEVKSPDGSPLPFWLQFSDGRLQGSPPLNFNGSIDLTVTASDGRLTSIAQIKLTIDPVNDAPVAQNDTGFVTDEDVTLSLAAETLLANDSDVEGDTLNVTGVSNAIGGTVALENGQIVFTPDANFYGDASFNYSIADGQGEGGSAIASVTVLPVNDAPIAMIEIADVSGLEDQAVSFALATNAFTDVDGDSLSYAALLANGDPLPSWLAFDGQQFSGTPPHNFNGVLTIAVLVSDGTATAAQQFNLTIAPKNDAPVLAEALADQSSPEDQAISITLPQGAFADIDGDSLVLSATLAGGDMLPAWLTFANGQFTGTPPAEFSGSFEIEVTASDGSLSASDVFRLDVTAVNDAPVVAIALIDRSSAEDSVVDFTISADSFTDIDSASLALTATLANGAALPGWLAFDAVSRQFTGTPPANFNGAITVRVTASDGALSVSDEFALTITPVNDAPVAAHDTGLAAVAGTALVVQPSALLANDNDSDGDALSIVSVGTAVGGTVALNAQGQIVYTPDSGYQGTGSFSYTISDGALTSTATASVQVTANGGPWVYGTNGNDNLYGQANAVNRIDGLGGDDLITGGNLNDELVGGLGNDRIYAGAGNDSVNGGDGNDEMTGDAGDDLLVGGIGLDKLYGGQGNDVIDAGDGNDTATGDDGNDVISGGAGDDLLYAGAGNDSVDGGAGNDTITGDAGIDNLVGGAGNDTISGGTQNDVLSGGDGNDKLYGEGGNDLLSGGAGNDIIDGTDGIDTVDYSSATAAWTINLNNSSGSSGSETDTIWNIENVIGGSGNDTITGNSAANALSGGDGNDILNGGNGNDALNGDAGDDIITGGTGNDAVSGGTGTDRLVLAGLQSSYTISTVNGAVTIVDNQTGVDGNDGTDTIASIEQLQFKGGTTVGVTSPIILDLDGNGVTTFSAADSNARYDLDGDGLADDTSWFGNTEGMLFLDRDGNGTVSNAGEFSFIDDVAGARSDLDGLRAFDSNKDGLLSSLDAKFAEFKIWQDRDSDGVAEAGEILSLTQASVRSIKLAGTAVNGTTQFGDVAVVNKGSYTRSNGTTMEFLDAALTYFSSTTNMPSIEVQEQTFARKADKYKVTISGGAMTLVPKKGQIDPRTGALGASNLMTFKGKSFGLLSPIILDLDGDGIAMASIKKSKAAFDMNGDGVADDTGWTGKGDGFLVIDRNNDGKITHASELSFAAEDKNARSDLEALTALDNNGDRVLDKNDARFGELKVWVDANGNGVTDIGELKTLDELGITEIGLAGRNIDGTAKVGDNVLISTATFTRANGAIGTLGNAALAYKPGSVSASIDDIAGSNGRFTLPERVVAEDAEFEPGGIVDQAIGARAPTEGSAADQAAAILRGENAGSRFGMPQIDMLANGRDVVNIFDYYEQPDATTNAGISSGNVPTTLRLADLVDAPMLTHDLPVSLQVTDVENLLSHAGDPLDPSARLVALMVQDMSAFGAKSGESDLSWRRDGARPFDYFA